MGLHPDVDQEGRRFREYLMGTADRRCFWKTDTMKVLTSIGDFIKGFIPPKHA